MPRAGSRPQTPCCSNTRALLFPWPFMHRDGAAQYELTRVNQGESVRRILHGPDSALYNANSGIASSHATSSCSTLRPQTRGPLSYSMISYLLMLMWKYCRTSSCATQRRAASRSSTLAAVALNMKKVNIYFIFVTVLAPYRLVKCTRTYRAASTVLPK